jgi:TPR repeat protein
VSGCASTTSITGSQGNGDDQTPSIAARSEPSQEESCQVLGIGADARTDNGSSLQQLQSLAISGDVKAQYLLGANYYLNPGATVDEMRRNYQEAANWFRKSAEQGLAEGQAAMGWLYEIGHGVTPDMLEASRWYRKAAKQGMAEAQYSLALLYHHGRGVIQNEDLAEKWYLLAAEQGHVCAQNNLGGLYEYRTIFLKLLADTTTYKRGDPLQGRYKKYEQAYIEAYKWYAIAASNNLGLASKNRDKLEPQLTRAELKEAKKHAQEWIVQHQQTR